MKIILIGYMGSGKSAVGRRLAKVLCTTFIDLDTVISDTVGMEIPQIFNTKGEIFFRKKEQEILQQLLEDGRSFVLATGGGTPCYGAVMEALNETEDVVSVFLNVGVETLTNRLFPEKQHRPLISHLENKKDLNEFIRKHLFERNFYYLQAKLKVDANLQVDEVVSEIVLELF
ncbi:MAG TPA: shikimate kinase [Flavobacteriaceae bacterium]|nr:shikimate kinase [Flavobacteriaceae bacterium]HIN99733.1 shikimate kinase [Flavobacteriaceae bacterium]